MTHPSAEKARRFHALHAGPGVLVLANPWDALSARLLESLGFPALATTSAGVAWSFVKRDGEEVTREELVESVTRVSGAVDVPVSADIESGYGDSPAAVAETVRRVIAAGAVGINLEDGTRSRDEPLLSTADHASRIRAAREAAGELGLNLFINGRTDVYLRAVGEPAGRFDNAVARAHAYLEAGADGIFVPGVFDLETIERLVEAIPAPLNVIVMDGTPPVADLERVGLRRLSTGGRLAQAMLGLLSQAAVELRDRGTYEKIFEYALPYPDIQKLFKRG